MSVYGKCTVCRFEGFNDRTEGGSVCEDCRDYWLFGEDNCDECGGHGLVMPGDECPDCDGSGVEKELPGYIAFKVDFGYDLTPKEKALVKKYEYVADDPSVWGLEA
ncbi:MAG: hypothetical protein ACR2PX_01155 [Endozoicomonas sp.]|uniref:hypothetical protein n=1 Tax=Endozoicomonas sp. TaxID=1892382 RepID=UPI003D9B145E